MLWVIWRQQRGLLISIPAGFILAVAAMLVEGPKIHQDYAVAVACRPADSSACQALSNYFDTTDWHLGNGIRIALLAAPVLLALFAGPPLLARELESGMFRYLWTQGAGRVRWTVAKLVFLGSLVTLAALGLSQLFTWFFSPFLTAENLSVTSPLVFETRGISYAAWTLTAFCLGTFLGTLIRRVLPAMAASAGCYAALAAAILLCLRNHYPVGTFWPMQLFEGGWLVVLSALLCAGTIWLVRRRAA
jgi:hypothetical protein